MLRPPGANGRPRGPERRRGARRRGPRPRARAAALEIAAARPRNGPAPRRRGLRRRRPGAALLGLRGGGGEAQRLLARAAGRARASSPRSAPPRRGRGRGCARSAQAPPRCRPGGRARASAGRARRRGCGDGGFGRAASAAGAAIGPGAAIAARAARGRCLRSASPGDGRAILGSAVASRGAGNRRRPGPGFRQQQDGCAGHRAHRHGGEPGAQLGCVGRRGARAEPPVGQDRADRAGGRAARRPRAAPRVARRGLQLEDRAMRVASAGDRRAGGSPCRAGAAGPPPRRPDGPWRGRPRRSAWARFAARAPRKGERQSGIRRATTRRGGRRYGPWGRSRAWRLGPYKQ